MSLAEALPTLNKLTRQQKIRLIRKWAKELELERELYSIQPKRVYYLYTPYNMYGVARLMREAKENAAQNKG